MTLTNQETFEEKTALESGDIIYTFELYDFVDIEVMKKNARAEGKEIPFYVSLYRDFYPYNGQD